MRSFGKYVSEIFFKFSEVSYLFNILHLHVKIKISELCIMYIVYKKKKELILKLLSSTNDVLFFKIVHFHFITFLFILN